MLPRSRLSVKFRIRYIREDLTFFGTRMVKIRLSQCRAKAEYAS